MKNLKRDVIFEKDVINSRNSTIEQFKPLDHTSRLCLYRLVYVQTNALYGWTMHVGGNKIEWGYLCNLNDLLLISKNCDKNLCYFIGKKCCKFLLNEVIFIGLIKVTKEFRYKISNKIHIKFPVVAEK